MYTCTKLRFMAKDQDDQGKNSNSEFAETVEVSKNMTKRLIQIMMEYPWLAICHIYFLG